VTGLIGVLSTGAEGLLAKQPMALVSCLAVKAGVWGKNERGYRKSVQQGNLMVVGCQLVEGNRPFGLLVDCACRSRRMMADDRIFWQVSNIGWTSRNNEILPDHTSALGTPNLRIRLNTALDSGLRAKRSGMYLLPSGNFMLDAPLCPPQDNSFITTL
jgi:hypothetical protein